MLVFRFDLFSFKIWFSSSQVGTVSSSISNKDLRMISRSSFDASRSMQEPKALSSTKTYYRRMEHLQDPERLQRTVSRRNVTLRQLTQLPASHSMCALRSRVGSCRQYPPSRRQIELIIMLPQSLMHEHHLCLPYSPAFILQHIQAVCY